MQNIKDLLVKQKAMKNLNNMKKNNMGEQDRYSAGNCQIT